MFLHEEFETFGDNDTFKYCGNSNMIADLVGDTLVAFEFLTRHMHVWSVFFV